MTQTLKPTLALAALLLGTALTGAPAFAQDADEAPAAAAPTVTDVSSHSEESSSSSSSTVVKEAPKAAAVSAPSAPAVSAPKPPEPPKATGPTYNPPPPSGKDWGKLPQDTREQILNDWKALSEKDREPFIFYRERAMAKLPDSAYSDNPYKPDAPESKEAASIKKAATTSTTSATTTEEKSSGGGFLDKLLGKSDEPAAAPAAAE